MGLNKHESFGCVSTLFLAFLMMFEHAIAQAAAASQSSANVTAAASAGPTCNLKLIQSFGLKGSATPLSYPMDTCPLVTSSCCQPADQNIIYDLWVNKNISSNIDTYFVTAEKVYDGLFSAIDAMQVAVVNFYKLSKSKGPSNCLAFTRKLTFFDWTGVRARLMNSIKSMHSRFKRFYGSFYCTLCDANMQKFINADNNTISYSQSFCREIIQSSLPVLLYLHGHVRKYINLVNKFAVQCDVFGNWKNATVPAENIMPINKQIMGNLTACRAVRNGPNWIDSCKNTCQYFNYASHSRYFDPHLNGFLNATVYLNQSLVNFQNSGQNKLAGLLNLFGQTRRLQQTAAARSTNATANCTLGICLPPGPFVIYPTAANATYQNFSFTADFVELGIPVDFITKNVVIAQVSDAKIQIMSNPATAAQAVANMTSKNGSATGSATGSNSALTAAGGAATASKMTAATTTGSSGKVAGTTGKAATGKAASRIMSFCIAFMSLLLLNRQ